MINITDKTLLECMKNIQEDFLDAGRNNKEHKEVLLEETTALRKILKNKSMNLMSAGILYRYVSSCIDGFTENSYHYPENIATEIFEEWVYISNWIKNHYNVEDTYGMVSISLLTNPTNKVA